MGPLVPDIIGSDLNLIVAFLIGIAFGFVLEQAGFSSSRKLAGLFYGYDFVVLRVFFTAAITALTGTFILGYFGLLNLDLIYINPFFVKSMIVGGVIMGLGFIIGGFCPGTSVCAAATGKIDAMAFIGGLFLGVFVFTEGYPLFEGLYMSGYLGNPLVSDSLGMSRGLFAFLLVFMALFAFVVTRAIEKKVNEETTSPLIKFAMPYGGLIVVGVLVGFFLIFMPDQKTRAIASIDQNWSAEKYDYNYVNSGELAIKLTERDPSLLIVDVRDSQEFRKSNIPRAVNIPLDKLANPGWRDMLEDDDNRMIIFYADAEEKAKKASVLSRKLGDNPVNYVLKDGFRKFHSELMEPLTDTARENLSRQEIRFREKTRHELIVIREEANRKPAPKKEVKRITGGC